MIVQKIKDAKIRDDGNQAEISFQGNSGDIKLTMSFTQLQELETHLIELLANLRFNRSVRSDTPNDMSSKRETILVNQMELVMNPDGGLDFLVQSRDNRNIQISFHNIHGQQLRQVLGGQGGEFQMS